MSRWKRNTYCVLVLLLCLSLCSCFFGGDQNLKVKGWHEFLKGVREEFPFIHGIYLYYGRPWGTNFLFGMDEKIDKAKSKEVFTYVRNYLDDEEVAQDLLNVFKRKTKNPSWGFSIDLAYNAEGSYYRFDGVFDQEKVIFRDWKISFWQGEGETHPIEDLD